MVGGMQLPLWIAVGILIGITLGRAGCWQSAGVGMGAGTPLLPYERYDVSALKLCFSSWNVFIAATRTSYHPGDRSSEWHLCTAQWPHHCNLPSTPSTPSTPPPPPSSR